MLLGVFFMNETNKMVSGKTCCVTGHRVLPSGKFEYVQRELEREIRLAVSDGYRHFISGFAQGADLLFADIVARLAAENPALVLEAALPYRKRVETKDPLFQQLLGKCNIIGIHSETYSPFCFMLRNRFMVTQSQRVIAVYDGREAGGTAFTVRNAKTRAREIRIIAV